MAKLRLGVIGAGSWAVSAHLPALAARCDQVEFVGVCRKDPERLRRVQERFGFALASENYEDVIGAGLDICVVSGPAATHHEHAAAALASGAHVLCEKPMTIEPRDAWDLVELARRHDRQLLMAFGWNYQPMVRAAVALVEAHGIGRLEHLTVHMSSATRELLTDTGAYPDASPDVVPDSETWVDPSLSGGGYAQAQLSHGLALAFRLVPERVTEVVALMAPVGARVELHDAICARFEGGGVAAISGGSAHSGSGGNRHALEVRAIGSDGQLLIDVEREVAWLSRPDGVDVRVPVRDGDGVYDGSGPARALVDVALGDHTQNCAPGELGALTVEALAAAYRSARSGRIECR